MHGLCLGTMFVLSKNACILHGAQVGNMSLICIMRCYHVRPSTVVTDFKRAVIDSDDVIQQNFMILWRSIPSCPLNKFERQRKPRDKPAPYARKPGPKGKHADRPETSAKSTVTKQHNNLTLQDWLTIFAFINAHPTLSQERVTGLHGENEAVLLQPTLVDLWGSI